MCPQTMPNNSPCAEGKGTNRSTMYVYSEGSLIVISGTDSQDTVHKVASGNIIEWMKEISGTTYFIGSNIWDLVLVQAPYRYSMRVVVWWNECALLFFATQVVFMEYQICILLPTQKRRITQPGCVKQTHLILFVWRRGGGRAWSFLYFIKTISTSISACQVLDPYIHFSKVHRKCMKTQNFYIENFYT